MADLRQWREDNDAPEISSEHASLIGSEVARTIEEARMVPESFGGIKIDLEAMDGSPWEAHVSVRRKR